MKTPHQPTRTARVPFWVLTLLPLMLVMCLFLVSCLDLDGDDENGDGDVCSQDLDCGEGMYCDLDDSLGGWCQLKECQEDAECAEGFSCENYLCEYAGDDGCGSGSPCKEGDVCIDGKCFVSECEADGDCPEGEVCINSVCVDAE